MPDWLPLIEKIKEKFATWKGKLLSLAGRVTLINSVICSTVVFWMFNFSLPSGIVKQIDKLLKWTSVCHPRDYGGMGITDIALLNKLLLCKWWWKLFTEAPKPWNILIKEGYYKNQEVSTRSLCQKKLSCFWKDV